MFQRLTDILFPKVCGICDKKISKNFTCEKCSIILQYCLERQLCVRNVNHNIDKLICLFSYEGIVRSRILNYKFSNKPYIGYTFGEWMIQVLIKYKIIFDCVVPIPIHWRRRVSRGYNQSEILGRTIAKRFGVAFETKALHKIRNTVMQSTLKGEARKTNIKGAFDIKQPNKIKNKIVLLVDDVYTTGATAGECARILKKNGAKEVIAITIAHAHQFENTFFFRKE